MTILTAIALGLTILEAFFRRFPRSVCPFGPIAEFRILSQALRDDKARVLATCRASLRTDPESEAN